MNATIARWGNGFAIRIPSDIMKKMNLKEGDKIKISDIKKIKQNPLLELAGSLNGKIKFSKEKFLEARKELEGE